MVDRVLILHLTATERWQSKKALGWAFFRALRMGGPKVKFFTKDPSNMSMWIQSAPAARAEKTSEPRQVKSAARMDAEMRPLSEEDGAAPEEEGGSGEGDGNGSLRAINSPSAGEVELRQSGPFEFFCSD